jgi:hypothetical protein
MTLHLRKKILCRGNTIMGHSPQRYNFCKGLRGYVITDGVRAVCALIINKNSLPTLKK